MQYDTQYFFNRMLRLFPTAWLSDSATMDSTDPFYQVLWAYANQLSRITLNQILYQKLQTRIGSATDINLDQIAADLFGPEYRRALVLQNGALVQESDALFAARIKADAVAARGTIAAIQYKVSEYINTYYTAEVVLNTQLLGLDTAGGLDTRGGLDGRASDIPPIPAVSVFDLQSNPKLAARVGLTSSQFCVLFTYGGLTRDGFFVGRTHLGRKSHLLNVSLQVIPPLTSTLDAIVEQFKAMGTQQVYADNRGA